MTYDASMRALLIAIVLFAGCDDARTSSADHRPATLSRSGKRWVDSMLVGLPGLMCKEGGYLVSCFPQSVEDCKKMVATEARACLDHNPQWVPDVLTKQAGENAGRSLGTCAGRAVVAVLSKQGKFADTERCHDQAYWARVTKDQIAQGVGPK